MYKQCRTEQSANRQRQLEQGLLKAMLHTRYEDISVCDLCDELGIPRKAFYRYFSGKDGALYALIDHVLQDYDVHSTVDNGADTWDPLTFMEQVFAYWIDHKPLLDALAKSDLSGLLIQRALETTKTMDELPNFMKIHDRQLQGYANMFTVCGMMSMIVQWHHDGFSRSAGEMARLSLQLFSTPLFK